MFVRRALFRLYSTAASDGSSGSKFDVSKFVSRIESLYDSEKKNSTLSNPVLTERLTKVRRDSNNRERNNDNWNRNRDEQSNGGNDNGGSRNNGFRTRNRFRYDEDSGNQRYTREDVGFSHPRQEYREGNENRDGFRQRYGRDGGNFDGSRQGYGQDGGNFDGNRPQYSREDGRFGGRQRGFRQQGGRYDRPRQNYDGSRQEFRREAEQSDSVTRNYRQENGRYDGPRRNHAPENVQSDGFGPSIHSQGLSSDNSFFESTYENVDSEIDSIMDQSKSRRDKFRGGKQTGRYSYNRSNNDRYNDPSRQRTNRFSNDDGSKTYATGRRFRQNKMAGSARLKDEKNFEKEEPSRFDEDGNEIMSEREEAEALQLYTKNIEEWDSDDWKTYSEKEDEQKLEQGPLFGEDAITELEKLITDPIARTGFTGVSSLGEDAIREQLEDRTFTSGTGLYESIPDRSNSTAETNLRFLKELLERRESRFQPETKTLNTMAYVNAVNRNPSLTLDFKSKLYDITSGLEGPTSAILGINPKDDSVASIVDK